MNITDAGKVIAEAQAWFSSAYITPAKQKLWAEAIVESGFEVRDVRSALKRIAMTVHDERWRLEIAELLSVAREERRQRLEREAQAIDRPKLAAQNERGPESLRRTQIASGVALDIVERLLSEAEFELEVARRMKLDSIGIERRRAELQATKCKRAAAEAETRRVELQKQAEQVNLQSKEKLK